MDHILTLDPLELKKREEKLVKILLDHLKVRFMCSQSEVDILTSYMIKLGLLDVDLEKQHTVKDFHTVKMSKQVIDKYTEIAEVLRVPVAVAYNKCCNVIRKYIAAIKSIAPLSARSQCQVIYAVKWLRDIYTHRGDDITNKRQTQALCPLWVMRILGEGNSQCLVDMLGVSRMTASRLRRHLYRTARVLCRMWWEDGDLVGTLWPAHWVLLDRMALDGELTLMPPESLVEQYRQVWSLYHLVQLNGVYHYYLPRPELPRALAAFIHIHDIYNTQSRELSLICLQRRWYELVRLSRGAVVKRYRWLLTRKGANSDCFTQLHPLYWAVVNSFSSTVLDPLPKWQWLVDNQYVIQSKEQYKMLYGDIPPPTMWQINNIEDVSAQPKHDDDVEMVDARPALDRNDINTSIIDISDDDSEDKLEIDLDIENDVQKNSTSRNKSDPELNRSKDSTIDSKLLVSPVVKLTRIPIPPVVDTVNLCDDDKELFELYSTTTDDNPEECVIEDVLDEDVLTLEQLQLVKDNYKPTIEGGKCCRVRRSRDFQVVYRRKAAVKGHVLPPYNNEHQHRAGEQCKCCCLHLLNRDNNSLKDVRRARNKIVALLKTVTPDTVVELTKDPLYVEDELADFLMQLKEKSKSFHSIRSRSPKKQVTKRKNNQNQSTVEDNSNLSDLDLWQREKHKTKQLIAWEKTEYSQKIKKLNNKTVESSLKEKSLSVTDKIEKNKTDKHVDNQQKSNNINRVEENKFNKKRKLSDKVPYKESKINQSEYKPPSNTGTHTIVDAKEIENEELDIQNIMKGQENIGLRLLEEFEMSHKIPQPKVESRGISLNKHDIQNETNKEKYDSTQNLSFNEYSIKTYTIIKNSKNKNNNGEDIMQGNKVKEQIKPDLVKELNPKGKIKPKFRLNSLKKLGITKNKYKNLSAKNIDKNIKNSNKRKTKKVTKDKQIEDKNKDTETQLNENLDKGCEDMMELYLKERLKGRVEFGLKLPKQLNLSEIPKQISNSGLKQATQINLSEIPNKISDSGLKPPKQLNFSEIPKQISNSGLKQAKQINLPKIPTKISNTRIIELAEDGNITYDETRSYNNSTNEISQGIPTDNLSKNKSTEESKSLAGLKQQPFDLRHLLLNPPKGLVIKTVINLCEDKTDAKKEQKAVVSVIENAAKAPKKHDALVTYIDKMLTNVSEKTSTKSIENVLLTNNEELSSIKKGNGAVKLNANQSSQKNAKIGPKRFMNKLKSDTNDHSERNWIKKVVSIELNKNQSPKKSAKIGPKSYMNKLKSDTNEHIEDDSIKEVDTIELNINQSPKKSAKIGPKSFMNKLKSDTNEHIEYDSIKEVDTIELNINQSPKKSAKIGPKSYMNKLKSDTNEHIECDSLKEVNTIGLNINQSPKKCAKIGPKSYMNKLKTFATETEKATNGNINDTNKTNINISKDSELQQDKALIKNASNSSCSSDTKALEFDTDDSNSDNDSVVDIKEFTPIKKDRPEEKEDEAKLSIFAQKITFETSDDEFPTFNHDDEFKIEKKDVIDAFDDDINTEINVIDSKNTIINKSENINTHTNIKEESVFSESMNKLKSEVYVDSKTEVISLTDTDEEELNGNEEMNTNNQPFQKITVTNTKDSLSNLNIVANTKITDINMTSTDKPVSNTVSNVLDKNLGPIFNVKDSDRMPKNYYDQNMTRSNITQESERNFKVYAGLKPFSEHSGLKVCPEPLNKKGTNKKKHVSHPQRNINVINQNVVQNINIGQTTINQSNTTRIGQNELVSLIHLTENSDQPISQREGEPYIVINPNLLKELYDSAKKNTPNTSRSETNNIFNQSTSAINQYMKHSTNAMNQNMNQSTSANNQYMKQSTSAMNQNMNQSTNANNQYMNQSTSANNQYMNQSTSANNQYMNQSTSAINQNMNQSTNANNQYMNQPTSAINQNMNQSKSVHNLPWHNPIASNMYRVTGRTAPVTQYAPADNTSSFINVAPNNHMNMFQQRNVNINQSINANNQIVNQSTSAINANNQIVNQSTSAINQPVNNIYPVRVFSKYAPADNTSSFINVAPNNHMNMFQQRNVNINQSINANNQIVNQSTSAINANNQIVNQSTSAINQPVNNIYPVRVFSKQNPPTNSFVSMMPQNSLNVFQQNYTNINMSQQASPVVNLVGRDTEGNFVFYKK